MHAPWPTSSYRQGVPADKVSIQGNGESNPVTGTQCDDVKARAALIDCLADRRVEIRVTGVQEAAPAATEPTAESGCRTTGTITSSASAACKRDACASLLLCGAFDQKRSATITAVFRRQKFASMAWSITSSGSAPPCPAAHGGLATNLGNVAGHPMDIRQIRQQGAFLLSPGRASPPAPGWGHQHGVGHPGGAGGDDAAYPREDEGALNWAMTQRLPSCNSTGANAAGITSTWPFIQRMRRPASLSTREVGLESGKMMQGGNVCAWCDHLFGEQARWPETPIRMSRATVFHHLQQEMLSPPATPFDPLQWLGELALEVELVGDLVGGAETPRSAIDP